MFLVFVNLDEFAKIWIMGTVIELTTKDNQFEMYIQIYFLTILLKCVHILLTDKNMNTFIHKQRQKPYCLPFAF